MVRQGIPPRPSNGIPPPPPNTSAVSPSVQTPKYPPVTASQKKAKAAVPRPFKTPAVTSSPVFQTTKAVQSPGTVRAKAAVSEIPAFSSQVRPNVGFQTARSESTQGVLWESRAVAVEPEDGNITAKSPNPKVIGILPRIEVGL